MEFEIRSKFNKLSGEIGAKIRIRKPINFTDKFKGKGMPDVK
jgi:hypothetical protein